ncbi:MAG TPA: hypothetical protein DDW27_12945 [Bacteroidales bacterium]|nr:hypothetical protein [Bacteroidales bacterium]
MTDNELIKEILLGDKEKFRFIVEKYQQMVFRTCMGFVHDRDDAEDLAQDVFIQAYQSLSRFKGESAFSTWLYRIGVNASLNKLRESPLKIMMQKFEKITGHKTEIESYPPVADTEDPENILIRQEHIEWIQRTLGSLPENQKTAIVLSKYDDLSQKEIAEIMNTTEGAVEALLQRAKKNLREKLSGKGKNKSGNP